MLLSPESRIVLDLIRDTKSLEEALLMLRATGMEVRKYTVHYAAGRWEDQIWGAHLFDVNVELFFMHDGFVQTRTIAYDRLSTWGKQ